MTPRASVLAPVGPLRADADSLRRGYNQWMYLCSLRLQVSLAIARQSRRSSIAKILVDGVLHVADEVCGPSE